MARKPLAGEKKRIVVLGGGFGGAYAAQTLCKRAGDDYEVLLIDRNNYILFYPLLVEAGVGLIEGRHVVAPIRQFVSHGRFVMADVTGADLLKQQVTYQVIGSDRPQVVQYDHLVFALGSVTKLPPVPGLAKYGFQLKSLSDALELRDRGIRLLELANTIDDRDKKRDILRFIVVGANFSGVELAGEYEEFIKKASRAYPNVDESDIDVKLLEYTDRILPATSEGLSRYAHEKMAQRGIDVRVKSSVSEIGHDYAVLTDGTRVGTGTVVWTAGIAPHPLVSAMHLPTNKYGYIECERNLRVKGFENVWAIGDSATVLDDDGKPYAPTAQNASRQGPLVAKNVLATLNGEPLEQYHFNPLGAFAAFGHRDAVANVLGREFKGRFAWFLYRTTYLTKMPTWGRKIRLGADWFLDFLLPNPPVQLGIGKRDRETGRTITADAGVAMRENVSVK